jgi:hypothetical protein
VQGRLIWRHAGALGARLAVFVALPFFTLAAAHSGRLAALLIAPSDETFVIASSLVAMITAAASLMWVFGLVSIREAQLSRRLPEAHSLAQQASRAKSDFLRSMSH